MIRDDVVDRRLVGGRSRIIWKELKREAEVTVASN